MTAWDFSWTPPEDALFASFNVYVDADASGLWTRRASTTANAIRLEGLPDERTAFRVAVAPVVGGAEASEEGWSIFAFTPSSVTTIDAPADVANFSVSQDGGVIRATWDAVTDQHLAGYEVREGGTWGSALAVAKFGAESLGGSWGWRTSGATTYLIRAFTEQGQVSGSDASSVITIQAEQTYATRSTTDESGGGFAATKSNVEVSGGALIPTQLPAAYSSWSSTYTTYTHPWWWPNIPDGTYTTGWVDAGAVVNDRVEVAITATLGAAATSYTEWLGQVTPEYDDTENTEIARTLGAATPYDAILYDETLVDGVPLVVDIDTAPDGVPTSEGFRRWVPGTVYRARQIRLRFTFNHAWPFRYAKVTGLTWRTRRENKKDEGTKVVSGTGGTTVTFASDGTGAAQFTVAPVVTSTVEGTAGKWAVVDGATTTEFTVRVFDTSGETTGTVHWHALGV